MTAQALKLDVTNESKVKQGEVRAHFGKENSQKERKNKSFGNVHHADDHFCCGSNESTRNMAPNRKQCGFKMLTDLVKQQQWLSFSAVKESSHLQNRKEYWHLK